MIFPLGGLTREEFFAEYWRKEPLVVRGSVPEWLPSLTPEDYRRMLHTLHDQRPDLAGTNRHGVFFGQNLNAVSPALREVARHLAKELRCPSVWFDAVSTQDGMGIGCHYDNTDNFKPQNDGTKTSP